MTDKEMIKVMDTHTHIDNERFNEDREEVIARAEKELAGMINIGYDLDSSLASVKLAKKYPFIYSVVGLHPMDATKYTLGLKEELKKLAREEKVVAIGEIGLDYHWMTLPKEEQIMVFKEFLDMAVELAKPVVIHTRDAMEDTINVLKEYPDIKGVIHCYPGSYESAMELPNFLIGVGGIVTFKNGKKLKEVVKKLPLERIILETDCPYMAPVPHRGKRNEPSYVNEVAKEVASLKELTWEEVARETTNNAKKLFGI